MYIPEVFKYASVLSVPLFSGIAFFVIRQTPGFSLHKHTVSMSVTFINRTFYGLVFRINFIIKALLDFCFALYLLDHFHIPLQSVAGVFLISSAFLFGSLAYFVEGKHTAAHKIIVYGSGVLWVIGQLLIASFVGESGFLFLSIILLFAPILLGFGFLFAKKTNVFVQAVCMGIWYLWVLIYVFNYL